MSHGQQYQARLQANVQAANARNIQLEATIAQKSDQLAHREAHIANLNAQIQRLMASSSTGNGKQAMTTAMQTQINQATTRAMTAENSLKQHTRWLNTEYAKWKQQDSRQKMEIQQLQRQMQALHQQNMVLKSSAGITNQADMDSIMRHFKGSDMHLEAHTKPISQGPSFPATAKRKARVEYATKDDDEDDEEPM